MHDSAHASPSSLIQSNMGRDSLSGECLKVCCRCYSTRRVRVVGSHHLGFDIDVTLHGG
jgi:hypothetical protein